MITPVRMMMEATITAMKRYRAKTKESWASCILLLFPARVVTRLTIFAISTPLPYFPTTAFARPTVAEISTAEGLMASEPVETTMRFFSFAISVRV